jgi:hypothetical protein
MHFLWSILFFVHLTFYFNLTDTLPQSGRYQNLHSMLWSKWHPESRYKSRNINKMWMWVWELNWKSLYLVIKISRNIIIIISIFIGERWSIDVPNPMPSWQQKMPHFLWSIWDEDFYRPYIGVQLCTFIKRENKQKRKMTRWFSLFIIQNMICWEMITHTRHDKKRTP